MSEPTKTLDSSDEHCEDDADAGPSVNPTDASPLDERQRREDEMDPVELDRLLESANVTKLEANQQFGEGNYAKALELYIKALETAPLKFKEERATILSNCAAANIKLANWDETIKNASESIELGNPNGKSLERRAHAYSQSDEHLDKAIEDYKRLQEQFPTRQQYSRNIAELEQRLNARNERMKTEMMDQLKKLGNMCLQPFGLSTDNFQLVQQEGGGYTIQMKK